MEYANAVASASALRDEPCHEHERLNGGIIF